MSNSHAPGEKPESSLIETPVLVVGAGPAGQMAALMLSRHGIGSTIVERRVERSTAPKAHAVNGRTLEICAGLGLPVDEIYELATPAAQGGRVQFMSRLSGVALGSLPYERQDDAVLELTPYPLANISQPKFEEILSQAIDARPDISVLRGCVCSDFAQDADTVTAVVDIKGVDSPVSVRSRYLLAADGAGSRLREKMGIEMEGPEALQHFMMIHFKADLSGLVRNNPGILYFLTDPEVSASLIAFDQADEWVLMHSCEPAEHDTANFDKATCIGLINKAVGVPVDPIKVCNVSPWVMSSQVAARYRQGRVFLVGDAAHRFPPTGGLGLNTGMGDVQNITWKIAAVEKGWAGNSIFERYGAERKPVAEVNSAQSLLNAMKIFDLFGYLYGDDPEQQAEHYRQVLANGPDAEDLKAAIELQRPHFDSLRLQLGYSYIEADQRDELAADVNISDYRPVYKTGVCLPHYWVNRDGRRVSLLELIPNDRFTLLVLAGREGWQEILEDIEIPMVCLQDQRDFNGFERAWSEQVELADAAALLIRPDRHIAEVFGVQEQPGATRLRAALAKALCNPALEQTLEVA